MRRMWLQMACGWAAASVLLFAGQAPTMRITSPTADTIVNGRTKIEATVTPPTDVRSVNFYVDGHLVCTLEKTPLVCNWDPGPVIRSHHFRVVATFADGNRLTDNLHSRELGYHEQVRTDAILVPVIVTHHGQ